MSYRVQFQSEYTKEWVTSINPGASTFTDRAAAVAFALKQHQDSVKDRYPGLPYRVVEIPDQPAEKVVAIYGEIR